MIFGLFSGMFILSIVMAEGDGILDLALLREDAIDEYVKKQEEKFFIVAQKNEVTDRFFSMFDDMLEANVFD